MADQTAANTDSTTPTMTTAAPAPTPTLQVPAPAHTAAHTTAPARTLADILHSYHARATPEQQRDWAAVAPHIIASQRPLMFIATYGDNDSDLDLVPLPPTHPTRARRRPGWYVVAIVVTVCVGCLVGVGMAWMQIRWAPLAGPPGG